jgi:hypothetical protein
MSDLLKDLEDYFIDQSIVTADGTDIFRDFMPESPDNCVSLIEYSGDVAFMAKMANRSVQVKARNTDYDLARAKINALFDAVYDPESDVRIVDFTAGRWGIVKPRQYPFMLPKVVSDERFIFVFNMSVVTPFDS